MVMPATQRLKGLVRRAVPTPIDSLMLRDSYSDE
jgi:hypothetical protein